MTILVICLLTGVIMLGMDLFTESRCGSAKLNRNSRNS
jgi:hypothetical protein